MLRKSESLFATLALKLYFLPGQGNFSRFFLLNVSFSFFFSWRIVHELPGWLLRIKVETENNSKAEFLSKEKANMYDGQRENAAFP